MTKRRILAALLMLGALAVGTVPASAAPTKARLVMVGSDCGDSGRPSAARPYLSGSTLHFNGYTTCGGARFSRIWSSGEPLVDGVQHWPYSHVCNPGVDPCSSNVTHSPPLSGCHNYRTRTHGYVQVDSNVWWDLGSVTSTALRVCG